MQSQAAAVRRRISKGAAGVGTTVTMGSGGWIVLAPELTPAIAVKCFALLVVGGLVAVVGAFATLVFFLVERAKVPFVAGVAFQQLNERTPPAQPPVRLVEPGERGQRRVGG